MRRYDREVKDWQEILAILDHCKICRLGMLVDGMVYIVPMNFGYSFDGKTLSLFFHSALEGKKISALRENASISFEMDCAHQLISADKACAYSFAYESLMGQGRVQFLETDQEKLAALQQIMLHQTGQTFPASDYNLAKVLLFKLIVEKISAKKSH